MSDKITSYLTNPLNIQSDVLTEFDARLNNDKELMITDSNNTFMFLLETMSRVVSESVQDVDNKLNSLYPKRAQTIKDLYNHVSDYEYVGFFAYPASTRLSMLMNKDYIIENAVQYGTSDYKVIIIPRDSIFELGQYKFTLYYPIVIRVNNIIGNITIVQDTSNIHPLHSIRSNSIIKREFDFDGVDLIQFEFDVFQFTNEIIEERIQPKYGFRKKYKYSDLFYAIRVFGKNQSGTEIELKVSLSETVYDPHLPTAIVNILTDSKEIDLFIPQIYLDNGSLGSELRIELMTTLGSIDVYLANFDKDTIQTTFALSSPNTDNQYSNMLTNLSTIYVNPVEKRITGGSNNLSFDEMKDIIIYHKNYDRVPVTNAEIEVYFNKNGFNVLRKRDNITDRVFYGFRKLKYSSDNILVGVLNSSFIVYPDTYETGYSCIKKSSDQLTILPSCIFKYNSISKSITPINDSEMLSLYNDDNKIDMFNSSLYMNTPYHLSINYIADFPSVWIFDLMNTSVSKISFEKENIYMSAQVNIISSSIKHLSKTTFNVPGDDGYIIRIGISKSDEFKDIPENDFTLYMTFTTIHGVKLGLRGIYVTNVNGMFVYDFKIESDYMFTEDGISVTNLANSQGIVSRLFIPLQGTLYISSHVKSSHAPGVSNDYNIASYFIEDDGTNTAVALQSIDYVLGENVSDVIDTNLVSNWSAREYERYQVDVPDVYEHDVYETNGPPTNPSDPPEGSLKYTIVNGEVVLNKLHSVGDPKLDENNNPIIKYREGDIKTTNCGEPIVSASRSLALTVNMVLVDFKYSYYDKDFLFDIAATMKAYLNSMRTIQDNILENTSSYFRPITTMADALYKINNESQVAMKLDLSFSLKCYTSQAVYKDLELRKMIESEIIKVIEKHLDYKVVSFVTICNDIKDNLGDIIVSLDIMSINGKYDLQTIAMVEEDKKPILKKVLKVNPDNSLSLIPDVEIVFEQFDV
jgi:hypothetical protein